ncbi:MAG: PDZ domain-containing protein [Rubripirellula sp.]
MARVSVCIALLGLLVCTNGNAQVSVDFRDVVQETASGTVKLTWETPKNKQPRWRVAIPRNATPAVPPNAPNVPDGMPHPTAIMPSGSYHAFPLGRYIDVTSPSRVGFAVTSDLIVSINVPQDNIQLEHANGETSKGTVLLRDQVTGLAAIRIEGHEFQPIEVAETVAAAGTPVVLHWLPGHVVGSQAAMVATPPFADEHQLGFVQLLDTPADPSKQGSPIVDPDGRLVGILINKSDRAFSISPHQVRLLIEEAEKDNPEDLIRGRLGLRLGTDNSTVKAVMPSTPAADAELQPGDVILKVGDSTCKTHLDVLAAVSMYRAGDEVLLKLDRDGEPMDRTLKLSKLTFGATNRSSTAATGDAMQQMFQLKDGQLVPLGNSHAELMLDVRPKVMVGGLKVERSKLEESLKKLETEKQRQDALIEELRKKISQMEAEASEKIRMAKEADQEKLEAIVEEIKERLRLESSDK